MLKWTTAIETWSLPPIPPPPFRFPASFLSILPSATFLSFSPSLLSAPWNTCFLPPTPLPETPFLSPHPHLSWPVNAKIHQYFYHNLLIRAAPCPLYTCAWVSMYTMTYSETGDVQRLWHTQTMGWLRLVVGSLKLQVSFAKEPYKRDYILQKRPMILRSVLIVATPYVDNDIQRNLWHTATMKYRLRHTMTVTLVWHLCVGFAIYDDIQRNLWHTASIWHTGSAYYETQRNLWYTATMWHTDSVY